MSATTPLQAVQSPVVSCYRSGEFLRSRSVGAVVLTDTLDLPAPAARLRADWHREIHLRLGLEPGDVEALSLVRARSRWPDYRHCVQAVSDWTRGLGLQDILATSDVALMACRGAKYHHDGVQYGGMAFCNLFLSEDKGLDLHFPHAGYRIPLTRGTAVVFDTGQAHAVIARHSSGFEAADFPADPDRSLVFLTWELPIENTHVAQALGVTFDPGTASAPLPDEEQVLVNGAPARLCPDSGRWIGV